MLPDRIPLEEVKQSAVGELEPADVEARLVDLARLSKFDYELRRMEEAERLGVRPTALDEEVNKRRGNTGTGKSGAGREMAFSEPEYWPEAVDGDALLDELVFAIRKYVVMPEGTPETVALWVVHTYAFEAFQITPRLNIHSPEKGCGKTTLLDVLECLASRSLRTENISTAVLFRIVEKYSPTLLMDEIETFRKGNEELRGALNGGHRHGGQHLRCVGDENEVRGFKSFAPVATAGIGKLPDTLVDRSIPIKMKRSLPGEIVENFRSDRAEELRTLAVKAARWVNDNLPAPVPLCQPH